MIISKEAIGIVIRDLKDFSLSQTVECGQCFNYDKIDDNEFVICAHGRALHVKEDEEGFIFLNSNIDDVRNIWVNYFDLETDYSIIKENIVKADKRLSDITEKYYGIRILNQEFVETLLSFIISQNNQIPRIRRIINDISTKYGEHVTDINGKAYYAFPDLKTLSGISEDDFKYLKTGFRAGYLTDAISKLNDGTISEDKLKSLDFDAALNRLKGIQGVGDKVASCVLLFSLGFKSAFPVDVWIKRVMQAIYFDGKETDIATISGFASDKFGEYGGYAQQYLFCYARENGIGTK